MPYADPIREKEYHRAYNRRWQQENRERVNAYHREYYKQDEVTARKRTEQHQRRQECNRIKREAKNRPCADCHIHHPFYVMDFDHVPERGEKLFDISTYKGAVVNTLKAEITKCDVVCANCHRERTWGRSGKEVQNGRAT